MVGTFGHCAAMSFCQNKIISTGEGGALITDNKFIYDQAKLLRSHGRSEGNSFDGTAGDYVALGYNFRMSSITAALGLSQMEHISKVIQIREMAAWWYTERLKGTAGLILPGIQYHNSRHVYQLYTIRIADGKRDMVMNHLKEKGIGCKVYFNPVHLTSFYKRDTWSPISLPITEAISKTVLSLPMYPSITESEIDYVCKSIKEVM
jgi:dTDP-4-amino-4,6-dideoxygalactose transaminase